MLEMKLIVTKPDQAPETVTIRLSTPRIDPSVERKNLDFFCTVDLGSLLPVPLDLYGVGPIDTTHIALIFCHQVLCSEHKRGSKLQWVNGPLFEPSVTFVLSTG
jgi:hypothetical protein